MCCTYSALQEKAAESTLEAAEDELELVNREKQQKINQLDVVVPLRLHQVNSPKLWRFAQFHIQFYAHYCSVMVFFFGKTTSLSLLGTIEF